MHADFSGYPASASEKNRMAGDLLKPLPKSSNSPEGSNSSLLGSNADHRPFKVFQRLVQRLDDHVLPTRLPVAVHEGDCPMPASDRFEQRRNSEKKAVWLLSQAFFTGGFCPGEIHCLRRLGTKPLLSVLPARAALVESNQSRSKSAVSLTGLCPKD